MEVNNFKNISELKSLLLNEVEIYPDSIQHYKNNILFIGKKDKQKHLYIVFESEDDVREFTDGVKVLNENGLTIKKYPLNTLNRKAVQQMFIFTNPVVAGLRNSFGFGDRIGLANPGHIRSLNGFDFFPILAQQSIRELTRTNRTADEVMDAAVWSVFQEGYNKGFSADADHLKTTADIDMMLKAGYKMITFDPGEYVENKADILNQEELLKLLESYPWKELNDSIQEAVKRYISAPIILKEFLLPVNRENVIRGYSKYGRSLAHVKKLHDYLKINYPEYDYEIEISVDETDSVTTVFEHYFISSELHRMKIKYISLAPRFVGSFEKGIEYKGDLSLFENEYKKHMLITEYFGDYKISLHSGSDKFAVYRIIGKLKGALVHVKTAGTSYLEALKVVGMKQPELLREILDYSRGLYDEEKRTYHVSADINKIRAASEYTDEELVELFTSEDARQIFHVTFGKVLTEQNTDGKYLFKDRIVNCLISNEITHYEVLIKHFNKHMIPFS